MSTQQKSSGGGRKNKSAGAGQKDGGVALSEQNNNSQISSKKHNNVNAKDAVNNNTAADQSKTEKEKPHVKVSTVSGLLVFTVIASSLSSTANSRTDSYRSDYRDQKWNPGSNTREGFTVDGDDRAL
jgi:hypothetical protein